MLSCCAEVRARRASPRARRRPARTQPQAVSCLLAGREYRSVARGLGRGVRMSEQPVESWGCAQEQSRGLRAARALQAWHNRLEWGLEQGRGCQGQSPKHGMLTRPQACPS